MSDRIEVLRLRCRCETGFQPHEQRKAQEVLLTFAFTADLREAAATGDVASGIDYRAVTKAVIARVEGQRFPLLEGVAQAVADTVLDFGAHDVEVRAEKPGALRFAKSVAVTMTKTPASANSATASPAQKTPA